MDYYKTIILDFPVEIQESIALKTPQIKPVFGESIPIEDIRNYGYEFAMKGDTMKCVMINNKEYIVKDTKTALDKLNEMVKLEECTQLSPSIETVKKIYEYYCEICKDPELLDKAFDLDFFKYSHNENKYRTVFVRMNHENSVVASMLFYLYH